MLSCSCIQDAVPCHPRCNLQPSSYATPRTRHPCQLQLANYNFNSTPVALLLHPCRSATPPLSLCTSTPVALQPRGGLTPCFWDATWPHVLVVHPVNICNQNCNCSRLQMAEMAMAFNDATFTLCFGFNLCAKNLQLTGLFALVS